MDRRVMYTKRALRRSVLDLVQKKPMDKISIKELCEHANINRGTFYSHYKNTGHVISEMAEEFLNDLKAIEREYREESVEEVETKMLEAIWENRRLCKTLISGELRESYLPMVYEFFKEELLKDYYEFSEEEEELYCSFFFYGMVGVIENWLNQEDESGMQEMVMMTHRMISKGLSSDRKLRVG